jgi:hypothetical protein
VVASSEPYIKAPVNFPLEGLKLGIEIYPTSPGL